MALVLACLATAPALAQQPASDNLKAQRRQITELYKAGNYSEAFAQQRTFVAHVEAAETAEDGKPGPKTADALGNLAWYALTARDFAGALAAVRTGSRPCRRPDLDRDQSRPRPGVPRPPGGSPADLPRA